MNELGGLLLPTTVAAMASKLSPPLVRMHQPDGLLGVLAGTEASPTVPPCCSGRRALQ